MRYCLNARGKNGRLILMDYNSPASIAKLMSEHNIHPLKRFGQNFLINENARASVVAALNPKATPCAKELAKSLQSGDAKKVLEGLDIWEVGPGLGAITKHILTLGASVTAFEIDKAYGEILKDLFAPFVKAGKLKIVLGDVMRTWAGELLQKEPCAVVGNLPYNIAATFIADTVERGAIFPRCVYTTQKEVAMRLVAPSGNKDYSSLSVLVQTYYDVQKVLDIGAACFYPVPAVQSTCVALTKKNTEGLPEAAGYSKFVRSCFSKRRKTLSNNIDRAILEKALIDGGRRAETLTIKEFLALFKASVELKG